MNVEAPFGTGTSTRTRTRTGTRIAELRTARAGSRDRHVHAAGRVRAGARLGLLSPIGRALLVMAVLCWVIGLTLRVTELSVIALVLTVPFANAALSLRGRAEYAVAVELRARRVTVGTKAVGRVEITNRTRRATLPSRAVLAIDTATAQLQIPRLAPAATHEELFAVPTTRRAVLRIGPVHTVREDPLSLMGRQITGAGQQHLHVHPRTVCLDAAAGGSLRDLEGTASSHPASSDLAFHALREHAPGDDRRHVHWRTTARTGTIMVRQFDETRRSHVVVALDNLVGHYASDEEFELAVSAAASISLQALREALELTAFSIDESQRTDSGGRLMDDYTVAAPIRERVPFHELGQKATDLAESASAVVMVVGARATAQEVGAAARWLPGGVRTIVIRCDGDAAEAGVRRSAFGAIDVVTIGSLDVLARALRAVGR